jgi:hypothetical protein
MENKLLKENREMLEEIRKTLASTTFRYHNCNPKQKCTEDCVIRAISSATGDSWEYVARQLVEYMVQTGEVYNTPKLYGKYLKDVGWVKQKQPVNSDGSKMKIKDFLKTFKGQAIVHAGRGHVTYIAEGHLWDIWNCENEIIGNYWTPENESK